MTCYYVFKITKKLIVLSFFIFSLFSFAQLPTGYSADLVQSGYNSIMGVVFNSDGTKMFVWEKRGHVYVSNWDGTQYIKQTAPVLDISDEVGDWRDFGFSSFCLDPDFDTNGLVYMFYMVDREHLMNFGTPQYDPNDNDYFEATISRVTRYKLNIASSPLTTDYNSRSVLLGESVSTGVPLLHESHAGGTILFGTDGTLLVTTGDNASYSTVDAGNVSHTYYQQAINDGILRPEENVGAFRSQMPTSLCGKLLRLDPDTGDGISSNPFYDSGNPRSPESRMWAMGLRNPFRMSIEIGSGSTNPADSNPGIIHVSDVGWGTWEDLHIFDKAGLNAGWPLYEGLTVHNGYWNTGTTNPDESNVLFRDNCSQPTNWIDNASDTQRRYTHNRPEVAWRHGANDNDARVPWFNGSSPTDPLIGVPGSPTSGGLFTGNTASGGVVIQGDALGSSMTGKYFFTDYVANWIQLATFNDGSQNWISDITEFAPRNFGSGIVHMYQNPLDGFVYYVNIFTGTLYRISFVGPTWSSEPSDMIVECDGTTDPGSAYATWLTSFSGTVSCGSATVTHNASGLSNLCGTTGSETVTFTLKDDCGNEKIKQATFTITDTIDPTFNEALPSSDTVVCDAIPSAVTLTAMDTCGSASVVFNESSAAGACVNESTITRTWTATDDCGNDLIHTQILTVVDTVDPTFNEALPSSDTVACDAIPSAVTLTAMDTCGSASVVFNESSAAGACANESTITRTWTATDDCGNDLIHTQILTVVDTIDPTFNEALPSSDTVACDAIPSAVTLTAMDTCGSASVVFNESSAAGACANESTITRTWTATDDCGNDLVHTQVLTVVDTIDPIWSSTPTDMTVQCSATSDDEFTQWLTSFSGSDTCGNTTVSHTSSGTLACGASETVTFTLTDDCGNSINLDATFTMDDTLGIEDSELADVLIFPNPANDHIIVKGLKSKGELVIYNLAGQRVFSSEIENNVPEYIHIASGLYMVKVISENSSIIKKLIVE